MPGPLKVAILKSPLVAKVLQAPLTVATTNFGPPVTSFEFTGFHPFTAST